VWSEDDGEGLYLVVKATSTIKVVEKCRVGRAAPKVHIGNLKIAPNCVLLMIYRLIFHFFQELEDTDVQWHRL